MTRRDLQGHLLIASLFKQFLYSCAATDTIWTDTVYRMAPLSSQLVARLH